MLIPEVSFCAIHELFLYNNIKLIKPLLKVLLNSMVLAEK